RRSRSGTAAGRRDRAGQSSGSSLRGGFEISALSRRLATAASAHQSPRLHRLRDAAPARLNGGTRRRGDRATGGRGDLRPLYHLVTPSLYRLVLPSPRRLIALSLRRPVSLRSLSARSRQR